MRKVNKKSSKKKTSKRKPRYKNLIKNFSLAPLNPFAKKSKLPTKYIGKDNTGIGTDGGVIYVRSPNGTPTARIHQMLEQMLAVDKKDIIITFIPDNNKNVEYDLTRKPPPKEDDEMARLIRGGYRG